MKQAHAPLRRTAIVPLAIDACVMLASLSWASILRKRAQSLAVVECESAAPANADWVIVAADHVELPDSPLDGLGGVADTEHAQVIDLIPGDLPTMRTLETLSSLDPRRATKLLAPGRGAGQALAIRSDLAARLEMRPGDRLTAAEMVAATASAHAAGHGMLHVVVPGLEAGGSDRRGADEWAEIHGDAAAPLMGWKLVGLSLLAWRTASAPIARRASRLLPAIGYALVPFIAIPSESRLKPRDLNWKQLLRPVTESIRLARLLVGNWWPPNRNPFELRRAGYRTILDAGVDQFFEPAVTSCGWCGGNELNTRLCTRDLSQNKPGVFELDRCASCGLVFQNPRVTAEGLNFYYGDFYDGLGAVRMELAFAGAEPAYLSRARAVEPFSTPERWLDVGTGHAHFCRVAREVFPNAAFFGLDRGPSVEVAARRGWLDEVVSVDLQSYSNDAADQFDVVSMFHYLEHTRDPRSELEAAARLVVSNGVLAIEVPDPESKWGRLLGPLWTHWFQPQHLNLVPLDQLTRELERLGFVVVSTQRAEAHQAADLFFAAAQIMNWVAPDPRLPWLPPPTRLGYVRRGISMGLLGPVALLAYGVDVLLGKVIQGRWGWSNAYRVVATKTAAEAAPNVTC